MTGGDASADHKSGATIPRPRVKCLPPQTPYAAKQRHLHPTRHPEAANSSYGAISYALQPTKGRFDTSEGFEVETSAEGALRCHGATGAALSGGFLSGFGGRAPEFARRDGDVSGEDGSLHSRPSP